MASVNADLIKEFGGGTTNETVVSPNADLISEFGGEPSKPQTRKERLKLEAKDRFEELNIFKKGLNDIINAGAGVIGYIDEKLFPGGKERNEDLNKRVKAENDLHTEKHPPSEGWLPNKAEMIRMGGQMVATAPLTPVKAIQATRSALGALPIAGKPAPFLNKAAASTIVGAGTGAEFGALTSMSNDKSLAENTTVGLITGAIAGPTLTSAAAIGKGTLPTLKNMWANVQINKIAEQAKMDPSAVKNVLNILKNAGYTPKQAQTALDKMGPDATLGDLANSITGEVRGFSQLGGKPSEIVKSRYEARANTANSEAHNIMEQKLGVKPDIELEKENLVKGVQGAVHNDYEIAKQSKKVLDVQSVVDDIDKRLETAVGSKEAALKQVKGFLYKNGVDANGNPIKVLKNDVRSLHEIRIALDDILNDKNPTTSHGKLAKSAIKKIREGVDARLKTVPEMVKADAKFSKEMEIVGLIDEGYGVLKNGMNKEEFARFYDNLAPNKQAAVQKGLRAFIGDTMEQATRGELSEAQRLFGKSSVNRANFEKVFGNNGTEVLDALQKQAVFRNTEKEAIYGSRTAENQAFQRKYGERTDGAGVGEIVKGMALDLISGTPGGATALMATNRAGSKIKLNASEGRKERLIEGTADIISRAKPERDIALDVINSVQAVQNKIKPRFNLSFPARTPTYAFSAPAGQIGYSEYKKLGQE